MNGRELERSASAPALADEETAAIDHRMAKMIFMHEVSGRKNPEALIKDQKRIIDTKIALGGISKALVVSARDLN